MVAPSSPPSGPRYQRLFKIGDGGMGSVYLGRMQRGADFSRLVAIKRTHPHLLQDDRMKRRLLREARLASMVRHVNVVSVSDIEDAGEGPVLILDYVEGPALSHLVRLGPLPHPIAMHILLEACHGLHAIHTATRDDGNPLGLVHCDVSPQNILVGVDGVTRIADFGIARSAYDLTRSGDAAHEGKVAYMAPEHLRNERCEVASDIYAMALVAWELLAGRRAFRSENHLTLLHEVLNADLPLLSTVAPTLGSTFDDVIARSLSHDPKARPVSAAELARELEAAAMEVGCLASRSEVSAFVRDRWGRDLADRRRLTSELEGVPLAATRPAVPAGPAGRNWRPLGAVLLVATGGAMAFLLLEPRPPLERGEAESEAMASPASPLAPFSPAEPTATSPPAASVALPEAEQPGSQRVAPSSDESPPAPAVLPAPRRRAPVAAPSPAPADASGLPPNPYE